MEAAARPGSSELWANPMSMQGAYAGGGATMELTDPLRPGRTFKFAMPPPPPQTIPRFQGMPLPPAVIPHVPEQALPAAAIANVHPGEGRPNEGDFPFTGDAGPGFVRLFAGNSNKAVTQPILVQHPMLPPPAQATPGG